MNNWKPAHIYPAEYRKGQARRHEGNPFIEAQSRMPKKIDDFMTGLAHSPKTPTAATRKRDWAYRIGELSTLENVIHPFPEYKKAAVEISFLARDVYIARHPLDPTDDLRREAIASGNGTDPLVLPDGWKSSAGGYLIVSPTGTGKTTFIDALLLRHKQVIRHEEYKGTKLNCYQIVFIKVTIPHDGTLKALCLAFFKEIDRLLKTSYLKQAIAVRTISQMVLLMGKVVSLTSLGFIVIDELQNLRAARGEQADFVLNLFIELIETLGIGLVTIATPAVAAILNNRIRNTRKLSTKGSATFGLMERSSIAWEGYCERMWDYTYTEKVGPLDDTVRNAWHDSSAGNVAFATVAFRLAQRDCIMSGSVVDATAFEMVLNTDLSFLQPAIDALKSGNPDRIAKFEDLMYWTEFDDLRKALNAGRNSSGGGRQDSNQPESADSETFDAADELDDLEESEAPATGKGKARRSAKTNTKPALDTQLPKRDALSG